MGTGDVAGRRDQLLLVATETVQAARRVGADPCVITPALHASWRVVGGSALTFDEDFRADPATGVEALAFVVGADRATIRGGLVLRLPGEWPDSFEAVDLPSTAPPSTGAVRHAFFSPST